MGIFSSILVGTFLFLTINQLSKYTTFGEAVSEMLENESVHKIMMSDDNKEIVFDLVGEPTINSIIEATL